MKPRTYFQMAIPKGLLGTNWLITNSNGPLDIKAECKLPKDWVKEDEPDVDWKSGVFDKNVKGERP